MPCINWNISWKALLQGQWISILIAGTGVFATILSQKDANYPLLMNMCNYTLLVSFLFRNSIRKYLNKDSLLTNDVSSNSSDIDTENVGSNSTSYENNRQNVTNSNRKLRYWYILAAFLDVEANFLVIEAYNYTTITSVMLLDCFTIPAAMLLSYILLGCRYTKQHIFGTVICLAGLCCIVINDSLNGDDSRGANAPIGDLLCILGSIFYAASNVLQEHFVKFHDREQYLGNLGFYGFFIALIQCMIVDLDNIRDGDFSLEVVLSIMGFVLCLFFMYVNTSAFLTHGDAILFNLSLLTSDIYAVVFTFFYSGYLVSWLYFIAFVLVIIGLLVYHSEKTPITLGEETDSKNNNTSFLSRLTNGSDAVVVNNVSNSPMVYNLINADVSTESSDHNSPTSDR